jgi:small subunit ribosomal protein S17
MSEIKQPRLATGRVVSNKMNKSITVLIERKVKHPVYHKYIKRSNKLYAHDEKNSCSMGDLVTICETRPVSKMKSWALVKVEETAQKI